MTAFGFLGLAIVGMAVVALCLRTGMATIGGLYVERSDQPKLFMLAIVVLSLIVIGALVGTVVELARH